MRCSGSARCCSTSACRSAGIARCSRSPWCSPPRSSRACGRGAGTDVKAALYHVQLNVGDPVAAIPFYRALFGYLEYTTIMETPDLLGVSNGGTDFWVIATPEERRGGGVPPQKNRGHPPCLRVRQRAARHRLLPGFLSPPQLAGPYD